MMNDNELPARNHCASIFYLKHASHKKWLNRLLFPHCIQLLIYLQVFELTDRLSKELQGREISVGRGVKLVSYAIVELEKMDSAERFVQLWKEIDELRRQHGADPPK